MTFVTHFTPGSASPVIQDILKKLHAIVPVYRDMQANASFAVRKQQIEQQAQAAEQSLHNDIAAAKAKLRSTLRTIDTEIQQLRIEEGKRYKATLKKHQGTLQSAHSHAQKGGQKVYSRIFASQKKTTDSITKRSLDQQSRKESEKKETNETHKNEIATLHQKIKELHKDTAQRLEEERTLTSKQMDERVKATFRVLLTANSAQGLGSLAFRDYSVSQKAADANNLFSATQSVSRNGAAAVHIRAHSPMEMLRGAITYALTMIAAKHKEPAAAARMQSRLLLLRHCVAVSLHHTGLYTANELDDYLLNCQAQFPVRSIGSSLLSIPLGAASMVCWGAATALDVTAGSIVNNIKWVGPTMRSWTTLPLVMGSLSIGRNARRHAEGLIWRPAYHHAISLMEQVRMEHAKLFPQATLECTAVAAAEATVKTEAADGTADTDLVTAQAVAANDDTDNNPNDVVMAKVVADEESGQLRYRGR